MKINIGQVTLEIIQGDITEQSTEAIVNAANNYLWMGAGVAGAIKRKGGQIIEDEAVAKGPIEVGDVVITTGGKLTAKYVIHAAGMGQDLQTDEKIIRKVTHRCLELAEQNRITTLSFPAIGTGVGGFEIHHCAKIMFEETVDYLVSAKILKKVQFVLFNKEGFKAFDDQLRSMFSQ
ncbi:MAG: macro domain-containing protein [Candidatus Marinimicrobia bacterium]|nr:macro domain-containing protein [Candidatus Neomarinimicrobiota bacterium]MBL7046036.1 macro domain-containing protein [Candidatus Neomarinimicrobiota bacterium]